MSPPSYADLMGFPFPQHLLMQKAEKIETGLQPGKLCFLHTTSVPPNVTDFSEVISINRLFKERILEANLRAGTVYGLQNPPTDLTDEKVEILKRAGIIFMCIAYFNENEYGGGFNTPRTHLKIAGKKLLCYMADHGLVLDLSHAGHTTARDVLTFVEEENLPLKIIATHSGCYSVYKHLRNLPDDILRGIVRAGGIIGLPTVTWMLDGKDNSLAPFMKHLGHLIDTVGEDAVGIGSDGQYTLQNKTEAEERFNFMSSKLDPEGTIFNARFPEECEHISSPNRMEILHDHISTQFGSGIASKVTFENVIHWIYQNQV